MRLISRSKNTSGVVNAVIGSAGIGPFVMLNTPVGTVVGYLTLTLPLVLILQTVALANVDRNLIQAAHNLGCSPARTVWAVIVPAAKTGLIPGDERLLCLDAKSGKVLWEKSDPCA